MKKTISLLVLSGIGAAYIYVAHPDVIQVKNESPTNASSTITSFIAKDDVEEARQKLEEATKKLADEESRIVSKMDAASTTAAMKIKEIEDARDVELAQMQKELDRIYEVRSSF